MAKTEAELIEKIEIDVELIGQLNKGYQKVMMDAIHDLAEQLAEARVLNRDLKDASYAEYEHNVQLVVDNELLRYRLETVDASTWVPQPALIEVELGGSEQAAEFREDVERQGWVVLGWEGGYWTLPSRMYKFLVIPAEEWLEPFQEWM